MHCRPAAAPVASFVTGGYYLFTVGALLWIAASTELQLPDLWSLARPGFGLALFAYFGSHVLRVTRLKLMLLELHGRTDQLVAMHFGTALVSAFFPFKSGELVRALEFGRFAGNSSRGWVLYFTEKFFDGFALIIFGIAAVIGVPEDNGAVLLLVLAAGIWIGLSVFIVSAPATFRYVRRLVLAQVPSRRSLRYLRSLDFVESGRNSIQSIVGSRGVVLALLTLGVWVLDFGAYLLLVPSDWNVSVMAGDFFSSLGNVVIWQLLPELPHLAAQYGVLVILVLVGCGLLGLMVRLAVVIRDLSAWLNGRPARTYRRLTL